MTATHKLVRTERTQRCVAVDEAVSVLGNKWPMLVLGVLANRQKALRYKELQRDVRGISQRMLTLTLKRLEENGLIKRTVFATVPARVDYELTPLGLTLIEPLEGLLVWMRANRNAMVEARLAHAKS